RLKPAQPHRRSPARHTVTLLLETLEDRLVPTFLPPVDYALTSPGAVLTGDYNGDGKLDVAAVASNGVSVLLRNGDGTFQSGRDTTTGVGAGWVEAGDFNRDGKLDLVTANASDLTILLSRGDGTFLAPRHLALGSNPLALAVGDFNADGIPDLGVGS